MRKIILSFFAITILLLNFGIASAQERAVCLVYFTSRDCGDDCELTDTFMDGLLNEYTGNLVSITYYVDLGQENQNVFQAYRNTYNLPQSVPIVLFGKNDYLYGINEIYSNTESKILGFMNMNGTNCPLDSGYLPPGQIGSANLRGQPLINVILTDNTKTAGKDGGKTGIVPTENDTGSGMTNQNPLTEIFTVNESASESLFSLAIIIAALVVVGLIVFFIWEKTQDSL